jgi:hypothetical protein
MRMTPEIRKLALTAHVTSSVSWMGAVGAFLALALAGLTSEAPDLVRASYLAMQLTGWFVIVPLSLAALPSGLLMSLGTEWGLFRHYWIVVKLVITVLATILLLVHMQPVGHLARAVAEETLARGEMAGLRLQLVADAGAALIALLIATALSIYKPRGTTRSGREQLQTRIGSRSAPVSAGASSRVCWPTVVGVLALVLVLLFVVLHLSGRGLGGH